MTSGVKEEFCKHGRRCRHLGEQQIDSKITKCTATSSLTAGQSRYGKKSPEDATLGPPTPPPVPPRSSARCAPHAVPRAPRHLLRPVRARRRRRRAITHLHQPRAHPAPHLAEQRAAPLARTSVGTCAPGLRAGRRVWAGHTGIAVGDAQMRTHPRTACVDPRCPSASQHRWTRRSTSWAVTSPSRPTLTPTPRATNAPPNPMPSASDTLGTRREARESRRRCARANGAPRPRAAEEAEGARGAEVRVWSPVRKSARRVVLPELEGG